MSVNCRLINDNPREERGTTDVAVLMKKSYCAPQRKQSLLLLAGIMKSIRALSMGSRIVRPEPSS